MRLKLYRAPTVAEAMAQIRSDLGPEALILLTRRLADGVELTAAVEGDEAVPDDPGRAEAALQAACVYHGLAEGLAARLRAADLAGSLGAALQFGSLPITAHGSPVLLAGVPGAGKTLSVARLATRLVLDGVMPMVITADGRRAGAAEELAAYTRLLGLNLVVAATPTNLARALRQRPAAAPVLIDTAGVNPFVADQAATVSELAEAAGACVVLVVAAGQHPDEAADQAAAFAASGATHLLPTRFDLARRLGSVFSAAEVGGLILTEAGIGPGATDGLTELTAAFLADRLRAVPHGTPAKEAGPYAHALPPFPRARGHAHTATLPANVGAHGFGNDGR